MDVDEILGLGESNPSISLPYDLTPGEVLVRHPYNQGYMLLTEAEEKYFKASVDGIFLIARCLGATEIVYNKHTEINYLRQLNSKNEMRYKLIEGGLDVKYSGSQALIDKMEMVQKYPQQELTMEQFNKALSVAKERGLLLSKNSDDIQRLLDARNPEYGSLMTYQHISVEVLSSLNNLLDIAFTLSTVPFFKLKSETKHVTEIRKHLKIDWKISF